MVRIDVFLTTKSKSMRANPSYLRVYLPVNPCISSAVVGCCSVDAIESDRHETEMMEAMALT